MSLDISQLGKSGCPEASHYLGRMPNRMENQPFISSWLALIERLVSTHVYIYIIWGFPYMGVPLNHPFDFQIFPEINQKKEQMGYSHGNPHMIIYV